MSERTRLGVLGWPVAHSLSPELQNAALRSAGLTGWRYQRLPVPPELFAETVKALPGSGFRGANVTIPHKQAALELAGAPTDAAREIGAANTLLFADDGTIEADNTDAPALLAALPLAPAGKSALVLGAGGSARAAVWALVGAGAQVRIWNRDPERARTLAGELEASAVERGEPADVLVNCTPVGMQPAPEPFKDLPLEADEISMFGCVVDLAYTHAADTPLVAAAKRHGVAAVDGLDLLIGQGALSFERFTGHSAPLREMRAALGRS